MRFRTCPVLAPPRHGPQRQAIALPLSFAPQLGRYSDLTDSTKPPAVRAREQSRSGAGAACRSVLLSGDSIRLCSHRAFRHDDIQPQSSQLGSDRRKRVLSTLGKTVLDDDVLPFDPAVFLQPLAKCLQLTSHYRRARGARQQKANPANRRGRLLRARHQWPSRRAAEQRYERAAPHSITSLASASSLSGTVRPSAFAVFMLITSSN